MDQPQTLGNRIRKIRTEAGLTQKEVAAAVGVTEQAISKWEADLGRPSLLKSPALAKALGVSLDCLLTGKKKAGPCPMSTYEYACYSNDASVIKNISFYKEDEFGKTLLDYIIEYDALEVFEHLLSAYTPSFPSSRRYQPLDQRILELLFRTQTIKKVYKFNCRDMGTWTLSSYPKGDEGGGRNAVLEKLMQPMYFPAKNFTWLLTAHARDFVDSEGKTVPFNYEYATYQTMYPLYAQAAMYARNEEMAELIIKTIEDVNAQAKEEAKRSENLLLTTEIRYKHDRYISGAGYPYYSYIRCIGIPKNVYEAAIANGYPAFARRLDAINKAVGKEGFDLREAELLEMRKDGKNSEDEILLASYTRDGIFEIKRFMDDKKGTKALLEKALKLPLLRFEKFSSLLKNRNYRKAFEMTVDDEFPTRHNMIKGKTGPSVLLSFMDYAKEKPSPVEKTNLDYIKSVLGRQPYANVKEMLSLFRTEILKKAKIEEDTKEAIKDFSSEALTRELEKGRYRHLAADLITKLEFLLRAKAEIEGQEDEEFDLVQAIDKYCGPGEQELLHKIRTYRNQKVHLLQKPSININEDDFKEAIRIVAKLAKEN